jgi:hypothetical protein
MESKRSIALTNNNPIPPANDFPRAPEPSAPPANDFPRAPEPSAPPASVPFATTKLIKPEYPVPYIWFILVLCLAIGIYIALDRFADLSDIHENWSEYRCQPHMMPLANLFGHNINENFQFCLNQIVQENTKGVAGPFAKGMFGFTSVLTNLMDSANSFRTMLATLVGGVIKIVGEFKARMTALMGRVKLTASRMKAMMYRVYGTMFAVIYMGLSAQTGIMNFGDTFIFKFIDTFCFSPEQIVVLENGRQMHISDIVVGDILTGGHRVESTYIFAANGQEMVNLSGIEVSSNHLVCSKGVWVMAKDHPDAIPSSDWSGGYSRPLVCLTTHDHIIDIGPYIFADYDETDKGNQLAQQYVHASLNGLNASTPYKEVSYEIGAASTTSVKLLDGYKPLYEIVLGDKISEKDRVVGIIISELREVCTLPSGQLVATGTLVWNAPTSQWLRASTLYPIHTISPIESIALFVSPGASYEYMDGTIVRDAMEVYSPDTKKPYTDILLGKPVRF